MAPAQGILQKQEVKETSMSTVSGKDEKSQESDEILVTQPEKDVGLWRDLTSYWIFGLCNNFGYVVMLTAAHKILHDIEHHDDGNSQNEESPSNERTCNVVSTGAILLADIIPGLVVKSLSPFIPFWSAARITVSCLVAMCGFAMVAMGTFWSSLPLVLVGVGMTSAASGLGEPTFLAYSAFFNKNVISTWSSGTGGAGIAGALAYALLSIGLTNRDTMLVMIAVPLVELIVFFFVLRKPKSLRIEDQHIGENVALDDSDIAPMKSLKEKLLYIKKLVRYMVPLGLVYFFEYLINQGLFELIHFPNNMPGFLEKQSQQYQWYQVTYQVGVFVSRSSVNIVHIKRIWLMAVLQGLNLAFFFFEAVYQFVPSFWIIIGLIFYEGLLGGGGYVNTFYRMSSEVPATRREFAVSVVTLSDAIGIMLSGFLSMPLHNWLCGLTNRRQ